MHMSRMFIPTLKEVPNDAEITSHQLMIRAGLVRNTASGIFSFLPLGLRVLEKIQNIVREEMNKKSAQQIFCSALQPKELWEESSRWDNYGRDMFRLKDRNDREFCLGPTHEEIFTNIIRKEINSYKQLPINLYQIQTKFRDEKRPRFGAIRSREFIMKDAYSFDIDENGLDKSYADMYDAYAKIFDRCNISWKAVLADTGAMGGTGSHQFMALSEIGESDILYCEKCGYTADREKAEFMLEEVDETTYKKPYEKIYTPNHATIKEIADFLNEPECKIAKTVVFKVDGKTVMAIVRGDREINKVKFCNAIRVPEDAYDEHVQMANEKDIIEFGSAPGFIGPIGLNDVELIVDREIINMANFYTGANIKDYHLKNVNYGRDFTGRIVDIVNAIEGDKCPECGTPLKMERGIEVGQVFKLGTKYSKSMQCTFLDEKGQRKPMFMGCYGIGISRTMAAIIEQHHDENGIVWPISVAPYTIVIIPVNTKDEVQLELAANIYNSLLGKGIETVLDDRDERAGVKFKDADLIGFPIRITVGKGASDGIIEFKERQGQNIEEMHWKNIIEKVNTILQEQI